MRVSSVCSPSAVIVTSGSSDTAPPSIVRSIVSTPEPAPSGPRRHGVRRRVPAGGSHGRVVDRRGGVDADGVEAPQRLRCRPCRRRASRACARRRCRRPRGRRRGRCRRRRSTASCARPDVASVPLKASSSAIGCHVESGTTVVLTGAVASMLIVSRRHAEAWPTSSTMRVRSSYTPSVEMAQVRVLGHGAVVDRALDPVDAGAGAVGACDVHDVRRRRDPAGRRRGRVVDGRGRVDAGRCRAPAGCRCRPCRPRASRACARRRCRRSRGRRPGSRRRRRATASRPGRSRRRCRSGRAISASACHVGPGPRRRVDGSDGVDLERVGRPAPTPGRRRRSRGGRS